MDQLGGRNGERRSRGRVELLLFALAVSQFSAAVAQTVIFNYGYEQGASQVPIQVPSNPLADITPLQQDDIVCLGDFQSNIGEWFALSLPPSTIQGEPGVDVVGRCLYKNPIQLKQQNKVTSFSTVFQVSILSENYAQDIGCGASPAAGTLQGLAFIVATDTSTEGGDKGYLGWLNSSSNAQPRHNFAVEIDFFQDSQFQDPIGIHMGIDNNSLISLTTSTLPTWQDDLLTSGYLDLTVWIEYQALSQILNIFVSNVSAMKPTTPMISSPIDLSEILSNGDAFVGFSGSLSNVTFSGSERQLQKALNDSRAWFGYMIYEWSFNSNGLAPDVERRADGTATFWSPPSGKRRMQKVIIISATIPFALLVLILIFVVFKLHKRNARLMALAKRYQIEDDLLEQGPQTFKYKTLSVATKGFSERELLGSGGFGSVYRGRLEGKGAEKPMDVAVKRISATSQQGAREFLAEVKIIGQAQHRNLVRLLGWCHERGELLLVYDFMPNGSVDQHLFKDLEGELVLTWARRLKIVSGVAAALAYLHEEWEQRVIHRDVKSSNVMLDGDFNARLGDFGLARLSEHDQAPKSTAVLAGTFGYLAPELAHTLKATEKTDVYAFGTMVLEMGTGRRPILDEGDQTTSNERLLVDWVWGLYRDDNLLEASDNRLQSASDPGEVMMFLKIGLLCSHPDPDQRPTMRDVLNIWKGSSPFPPLARTKPTPVFISTSMSFSTDGDSTWVTTSDSGYDCQSDASRSRTSILDSDMPSAPIPSKVFSGSQPEIPVDREIFPSNPGLRYRRYNSATALPIALPM